MEYRDYYKVLGVDRKATADEIKHAYRKLARKYHPDVSKETNAEEQFKNVQEAYEVLKDPEKRTAYDQLGSNWKQGQDFRPPPGWDHGQGGAHFYTDQDFGGQDFGGFSDFFANLFGGGGRGNPFGRGEQDFSGFEARGQDQHAVISIPLEEAFKGTTKQFQLQVPERLPNGQVKYAVKTLKVNIPPGSLPGQQLRLVKQGSAGVGRGAPGDLYLKIELDPHPLYSLKGHDIYLTLPVTPWEAALGADIKVPTLGGTVGLKLPAGSQSGQKLRLKGRGMPSKSHTGDQYAVIQIHTPTHLNNEGKEMFEKMAKVMPFNPRVNWPME